MFNDELSIGVSSFGGSVNVLDCGAVTADSGVDTEESLADRGAWRYGPEMVGFPPTTGDEIFFKLEADFFAKSSCSEGFLSLLPNINEGEGESGVREPSAGKVWNVDGEKFGRERTGIERRFSTPVGDVREFATSVADVGKWIGPVTGIGLLITGLRGVVGDNSIGGSAMRGRDLPCSCGFLPNKSPSTGIIGKCAKDE
jgi:hypothetical protein